MLRDEDKHRRRIAELELQQAQYDASLAERRYAACDPDNRLIAAQLEKAWEAALQRVEICRQRLDGMPEADAGDARPDLTGLADDLSAAWAPKTTMRTRQRLVRALITEIVADVDETAGEIVLVIHWKGGQHSELRVRKPRTGEHGCSTPEQALAVIRSMAGRWSDQDIAASMNRMGMPTGQGKTWTAKRVGDLRRVHGIHGYRSADKNGEWLTLRDAAAKLGVSHHQIRKLIKAGVLVSAAASSFTIPLAGRSLEVRRSRPDDTTWTPATPPPTYSQRGDGQAIRLRVQYNHLALFHAPAPPRAISA